MRTLISAAFLGSALLTLASCASLTKEECLVSDWVEIGKRDGAQGQDPQTQFQRHINACKRAKVTPDHTLWSQGYQQGLVSYCTPTSGLTFGQKGAAYFNVCPAETQNGFIRGYTLGKKQFDVNTSVNSLNSRISALDNEIDGLIDKLPSAKPEEVGTIKSDIREKRFALEQLRNEKDGENFRLSRLNQLAEQFLRNPQMNYDPNSL